MPYIQRREFTEAITVDYNLATGAAFVDVPGVAELATAVQGVFLTADRDITIRVAGQSDAGALLKAGGLFVLFDCSFLGVKIQNNSGSTAHIQGAVLGS